MSTMKPEPRFATTAGRNLFRNLIRSWPTLESDGLAVAIELIERAAAAIKPPCNVDCPWLPLEHKHHRNGDVSGEIVL